MIQGMKQGMVASPAMQLSMRALQANQAELQELIAEAIAKNPALEEIAPEPEPQDTAYTAHREFAMESLSATPTLAEHLEEQIRQSGLAPKVEAAALQMIPWLNQHGFFAESPATVQQELGLSNRLFQQALYAIQDLEPVGVGAADLRESLMIQLEHLGESGGLPMQLLRLHWDALVRHRYADIAKDLGIDEAMAEMAARRIARLNPDPGSGFSRAELHTISPDIEVQQDGDKLLVTLTKETSPQLTLSAEYREMMAQHADKAEVRQFLSRCFREGRELIRALGERQANLLAVAKAIVEHQQNFFLHNNAPLTPLKMEAIAADTGLHVSTVSRAVRGKYLKCNRGVFELRAFFSTAISATEEVSADAVKQKIRELIAAESPQTPLTDNKLVTLLQEMGITLARRTIAKYREQLKILPAPLRKRR